MEMHTHEHTTVLLKEAVAGLAFTKDAVVIDATLGHGGHASAILEKLGTGGVLLAIDADVVAVQQFQSVLPSHHASVQLATGNFKDVASIAAAHNIEYADAILADLGWRMEQFGGSPEEGGGKGFSFSADEPLAMTYGDPKTYPFTAYDIVNEWHEEDIANVIKGYGEDRFARRIARAIVTAREVAPITQAAQLADIVKAAVPGAHRHGRIHPATKTFQALRIAVNDELDALRTFIDSSVALLAPHGRLAIITFHSIEDRIVKHTFRSLEQSETVRRITKKPITASAEELHTNPRARSAKLRIIERI